MRFKRNTEPVNNPHRGEANAMHLSKKIERKIRKYNPKGGLDKTTIKLLNRLSIKHPRLRKHAECVGLLGEAVAIKLKKDPKATFFMGVNHDDGKFPFPKHFFDGRTITNKEYVKLKKHPINGYRELRKKKHLFTAYGAGIHHAMSKKGYGLTLKDIPKNWGLPTVKKMLEIATIIAICDYIDAALTRDGKMKSEEEESSGNLRKRLEKKFPDDIMAVRIALREARKIIKK